jgi:hypothetical protein
MRRSGTGSGGGYGSRPVTHVRAPKVEPKAYAKNPGGVAQYGSAIGNKITHVAGQTPYRGDPVNIGRGYQPPVGPTDNVAAVGVGGGRTTLHCGSQGTHGGVAGSPKPQGRAILSQYGPESSRPRNAES